MDLLTTETEFVTLPGYLVQPVGGMVYLRDPDKKVICFMPREAAQKYPNLIVEIQESVQKERDRKS